MTTAVDIQQEEIHWTHALELIPVLPFLKHLEIPIVIKDADGNTVDRVVVDRLGGVAKGLAGYTPDEVMGGLKYQLDEVGYSVMGQVTDNRCRHTCLEMLFTDHGIPPGMWDDVVHTGDARLTGDQVVELIRSSTPAGHSLRTATFQQQLHIGPLRKAVAEGWSAMVGVKLPNTPPDQGGHWMILDRFELDSAGREWVVVRDPATAKAWRWTYEDFSMQYYADNAEAIVFPDGPAP